MLPPGEVLVVGAGPTGLTMAVELLRRDIDVRIVDRSVRRNPHSKAIVLWPRALEVFARIGAGERIREMGLPITAANYWSAGRQIARINFRPLSGTRSGVPLSLPQNDTEEALREVLHGLGGTVGYGQPVERVVPDGDGVLVDLPGGTVRAGWLVGADGAHSTVRDAVGVPFAGAAYEQSFVLADGYWDTPLVHRESYYFTSPTGVLVVVGLPGGGYRVFGSVPPDATEDSAEELVRRIARERSPVPLRMLECTGAGLFRIQRRIADRFRAGRVLLAGDAAHVHSPAGGQGLNTSIQDAHEAAWRLAGILRGRLPDTELDRWAAERRHVARTVVADTDRQTRLWLATGWRRRVRDVSMRTAQRAGLLDRVMPPRLAQFGLAYPASGPALGRLAPGRRLPDLALPGPTLPDSTPPGGAWLHDHLRAGEHLLLVAGTDPRPWRRPGAVVVALDEQTRKALGVRVPGAVLVRPDGVVAVAGRLTDPTLTGRIDRALPPVPADLHPLEESR